MELFDENLMPFDSNVGRCIDRMSGYGYRPNVILPGTNTLVPYDPSMANGLYNVIFLPA